MANFPQMNLSPEATPWGREAQNRITALEAQVAALKQSTENSLRTVNGALTNQGYQSFAVSGSFSTSLPLSTFPNLGGQQGGSVQFTVTERRLVTALVATNFAYNKTSGGNSGAYMGLSVTLAGISYYGDANYFSSDAVSRLGASLTATGARVLDPGTYTASCACELQITDATSSPGGTVAFSDEYLLTVQVHGRA